MPYLTAAVVLVGLISVVNLMLTLALVRRLRAGEKAPTAPHAGPPVALGPGSRPAGFMTMTTADEPVSSEDLTGLVGFFSAGCDPCHALAPRFAEHARAVGRDGVLAVVGGDDAELVAALAPVARVVVEDFDGPVAMAFKNDWTPALYLIGDDQSVVAAGGRLEDLPLESRA
ncbi:peroxiredoxin family protein [Actinomadura rubrisoli]|uniref:TlpA family protein disulfide reductase n=1 Tax=Actinomadura rubrisoli TaxID=2530368 RepID=A0A4R5BM27_9ACTN|nr:TlpA family protein disulfide reductase [Actinomadura rubrisoli]TDD84924.1 TlpA family protein disulfide reductase [Actinomadura rubrisoli]